jgi:hypothetical protein
VPQRCAVVSGWLPLPGGLAKWRPVASAQACVNRDGHRSIEVLACVARQEVFRVARTFAGFALGAPEFLTGTGASEDCDSTRDRAHDNEEASWAPFTAGLNALAYELADRGHLPQLGRK